MINVTKPFLPNKKKYYQYLDSIWESNHLTNFGPLHEKLSNRLCEYLDIKNILLVNNGTIALQLAYKLLNLKSHDEVLTTPFSFIATTSTLIWEHLNPKFVDINENTLCINENLIEKNITPSTKAILPVHVFGNPCEVEKLEEIAKQHNLKLIFDAAHAFGVKINNKSVMEYGDISTLSFHATKIFGTIEGGALISKDENLIKEARAMINFGLENNEVKILGINAKMNEFSAAMGLCILDDIDYILEERRKIWEYYFDKLKNYFDMQEWNKKANNNYHYFPILFESENALLKMIAKLNANNIFPRRYFYPSLNNLNFCKNISKCPISDDIANRILCIPFYVGLEKKEQDLVISQLIS